MEILRFNFTHTYTQKRYFLANLMHFEHRLTINVTKPNLNALCTYLFLFLFYDRSDLFTRRSFQKNNKTKRLNFFQESDERKNAEFSNQSSLINLESDFVMKALSRSDLVLADIRYTRTRVTHELLRRRSKLPRSLDQLYLSSRRRIRGLTSPRNPRRKVGEGET